MFEPYAHPLMTLSSRQMSTPDGDLGELLTHPMWQSFCVDLTESAPSPQPQPDLLPGRAGGWWLFSGYAAFPLLAVVAVANVPDALLGGFEAVYVSALVTLGVVLCACGFAMLIYGARKCSAEATCGYTTDIRRARANPELPYFDHLSMALVSGPGEHRPDRIRMLGRGVSVAGPGAQRV